MNRPKPDGHNYRIRVLASIVASQLLLIGAVNLWPLPGVEIDTNVYHTQGQEVIEMEEILPTRQKQKPPPPPPPLIPVVVPDDVVIEELVELDDNFLILEEYAEEALDQSGQQPSGNSASFKAPDAGPKPLRFVEPEYTRAARRKKVRAEIIVEVLVDERGLVRDAKILERFLYKKDSDEKEVVNGIEYGLEESALSAAQRWMFQPAKENGQPVRSYTTLTFSFGV